MICDALNTFCDNTALNTGGAGSYIIGNQIDLQTIRNAGLGFGAGQLWLVGTVDTTATSDGSATAAFDLVTDSAPALNDTPAVVQVLTAAIPVASLVQGTILCAIPLPSSDLYERYLGIQQRTATAAFTAGKVNFFLTNTPPARRAYPDSI